MLDGLLLFVGLALLITGAHFLVAGACTVAARLGVSNLVIGLTIVSLGTSLPELLVTLVSGLQGRADLAIANVVGSNIANVLLVLGVAAIIRPLPVRDSTILSEIPFSLTAALLVGFLANAHLFSDYLELSLSRLDGTILLSFLLLFLVYVYKISGMKVISEDPTDSASSMPRAIAYILLGSLGLFFGGQWAVEGAIGLAQVWGVDDALIGLTIIAVGTSSPELVASAVAAYRNQTDIAVGNVVGSNIFNLLWVLGFTSSVVELPFEVVNNIDLILVIASSVLIFLALATSRINTVMRIHGALFVVLYVAYLAYVVQR